MPPKPRVSNQDLKPKDICALKHKGNENSIQADLYLDPKKKNLRKQIYDLIFWAPKGLSCEEIAKSLSKPIHSVSGRISELKASKLIVEVGRCQTEQGNTASIYAATVNVVWGI